MLDVVASAVGAEPAAADALDEHVVRHVDQQHGGRGAGRAPRARGPRRPPGRACAGSRRAGTRRQSSRSPRRSSRSPARQARAVPRRCSWRRATPRSVSRSRCARRRSPAGDVREVEVVAAGGRLGCPCRAPGGPIRIRLRSLTRSTMREPARDRLAASAQHLGAHSAPTRGDPFSGARHTVAPHADRPHEGAGPPRGGARRRALLAPRLPRARPQPPHALRRARPRARRRGGTRSCSARSSRAGSAPAHWRDKPARAQASAGAHDGRRAG